MALSINGFNIGTDARFAITDQFGDVFVDSDLGYLDEFDSESEDVDIKLTPITNGGIPIHQILPNGCRGRMIFTRFGNTFQQIWIDLENAYYSSGLIPQFSLQLSVRNRDSSIDEYIFTGLQFMRWRFGNFRSTRQVDMQCEFRASLLTTTGVAAAFLQGLSVAA